MSHEYETFRSLEIDDKIEDFEFTSDYVRAAFDFAREKHKGKKRKDGSEYFTHCVAVANLMGSFGIDDEEMVVAALCHDLSEDENVGSDELERLFGKNVARWVDGLTKLNNKDGKTDVMGTQIKVVDRAFFEPQVAILKLADRLHNMKTMGFMSPEKQKAKSRETLEVYVAMAESLGMWRVKNWLEDMSFFYLDLVGYQRVVEMLARDPRLQVEEVANIHSSLEQLLAGVGITGSVEIKYKGLHSADKKRERNARRGLSSYDNFDYVNDLVSYRVVLDDRQVLRELSDIEACYAFLGTVHMAFKGKVDIKRFDDFIVEPRVNNYRALQTTIKSDSGPIEIAIATRSMEEFNNWGVVKKLADNSPDVHDFVQKIVFLPSGKARFLPKGATGWDIAFGISPVLGEKAEYILVNGERKPLSYVVPNGAVIKVQHSKTAKSISKDVAKYVSRKTWEMISEQNNRHKLRDEMTKGREALREALREYGLVCLEDLEEIDRSMELDGENWGFEGLPLATLLMETGCVSKESLYGQIGSGSQDIVQLVEILKGLGLSKEKLGWTTMVLRGVDQPGVLAEVSNFIQGVGKNIVLVNNISRGNAFEMRMVISGMTRTEEDDLKEFLKQCGKFDEVFVV